MHLVTGGQALLDPGLVGNKFAVQAQLRAEGVRVPGFACVVDRAPLRGLDVPTLSPTADLEGLRGWAAATREAIQARGLPDDLAAEALAAFDEICGHDGQAAVRACVVDPTGRFAEDGADDPFAGLTDSFLYVGRDALLDRVVAALASLFSEPSVLYRHRRGIDLGALAVSVGIQEMVAGRRSVVAFTRDPITGARTTVIAAAHGIGEGVVQEQADIDHFFVSPERTCESRLVHKQRMLVADAAAGHGCVSAEVPAQDADLPVLSTAEALEIHDLCAQIEERLGGPQDVEATITGDGSIHVVQARPAVIASGQDGSATPRAATVTWTNNNLTESFPGVTCALTYSQARVFYRRAFRDFYRRMGIPEASLARDAFQLDRMVGFLDGRVYYRLDAWYTLHGKLAAWPLLRPLWQQTLGLTEPPKGLAPPPGERRRPSAAEVLLLLRLLRRFPRELEGFLRWWDDLDVGAPLAADAPPDELIARYRQVWAEFGARWGLTLQASWLGMVVWATAALLLTRWTEEGLAAVPRLLPGGPSNRTQEGIRSLVGLAERVAADPELRAALGAGDDAAFWQTMTDGSSRPELAEACARHLRLYGDLAINNLKLEERTPRQRPELLVGALRPFVESGTTVAELAGQERAAAERARAALTEVCPGRVRRAILAFLLRRGRTYIKAREDTRFCRSQLYGISREVCRRLAERLVADGLLDDVDDVAHLEVEELLGAFDAASTDPDLRATVAARRAAHERHRELPEPPALFTSPPPPHAVVPVSDAAGASARSGVLTGLASSPGIATGEAKIVHSSDTDPSACVGKILVARETDPGWLPLMVNAAGIIAERGSVISHTAITGRQLGIPTIVAVDGATAAIADGDLLEMDGTTGHARVIRRADAEEAAA
jgi:rifampicin phosphotransferase